MQKIQQHTNNNGWIKPDNPSSLREIVESIISADIVVSDIDLTVAPYSILGAMYSKLGRIKMVGAFLSSIGNLTRISQKYTDNYAKKNLYPEVLEFYKALPSNITRILVTRNAKRIAEAYRKALNFDLAYAREYDKRATIEKILGKYTEAKKFVIVGDNFTDERMLIFLRAQQKKGRIDNVTGIFVAGPPSRCNKNFDVNIGKHYGALRRAYLKYAPTLQH